jgi:trehalose-6-phosphate synthase
MMVVQCCLSHGFDPIWGGGWMHADQRLTSQVHEIVGRINGRFGTLTFMPIHHLDRSLAFHQLCALYAITGIPIFWW